MTIITVDMDDTLIRTSQDYQQAAEQFGDFVEHEYGIPADDAIEKQNEVDYRLLEEDGLKMERYPKSFVIALDELVSDPTEQHRQHAHDIGQSTFKTSDEYASRGFMDGVEQMLSCLRSQTDNLHLVTVGDPKVQNPKINGLGLEDWFDEIHIPSYEQGKSAVFTDILTRTTHATPSQFIHIGNSASSDVEPSISVGGSSVYISDDLDWLSDSDTHNELVNHNRVYAYETATEAVPDLPSIVNTHQHSTDLLPRGI